MNNPTPDLDPESVTTPSPEPVPEAKPIQSVDTALLRGWLLKRLDQPQVRTRLDQFQDMCVTLALKPAAAITEPDLNRIWTNIRNGVSDLPTSSTPLTATSSAMLRAATEVAQNLNDSPATRIIKLHLFFKRNGERYAQLPYYVRAAALFDPAHVPTVTAYRALPGAALAAIGYTGVTTSWETLIQDSQVAALDAAFAFAFAFIEKVLPNSDVYERAVGLELLPGFIKEQAKFANPPPLMPDPPERPEPTEDSSSNRPASPGFSRSGYQDQRPRAARPTRDSGNPGAERKRGQSGPNGQNWTPRPKRSGT
jgi:hypothetical protein